MQFRTQKRNRRMEVLAAARQDPRASIRELAEICKMSATNIYYYLNQLEREGLLRRQKYISRGINRGRKSHFDDQATREKKSAAGRKTKRVLESVGSFKKDPDLQKRIDKVVADALEKDHSIDVINDHRHLKFHSSGLKCYRLG